MRFVLYASLFAMPIAPVAGALIGAVFFIIDPDWQTAALFTSIGTAVGWIFSTFLMSSIWSLRTNTPQRDPEDLIPKNTDEKIVCHAPALLKRGLLPIPGHLILTNVRLHFLPTNLKAPAFHIPLDNVRAVRRLRFLRFIKLGARVQRHDRDHERLVLADYQEWHDKINHARRARRPTWINTGTVKPI